MMDFTDFPVIDHHCHVYEPEKAKLDSESLAREFHHGMADIPKPGVKKAKLWGASDELRQHFPNMGVVQTMICQLSKVLGCPPELEAVASERNRRTSESFAAYARLLYQDAGIAATVIDSELPINDPLFSLTPGKVLRLFQMEPPITKLLDQSGSYQEMLRDYQKSLDRSVRENGFVGVKAHLGERVGFGVDPVFEAEAKTIFPAAKAGNPDAYKKIYVALFTATLLQCQELGVPVHLHSGCTGSLWDGPIHNTDPFLLAPFLRRPEFLKTKIVLLHGGYPWTKQAGQMAHILPQVWVDMSQITPWGSLRIVECYRDVMAWAPLSKITIGSGGHGTPEIAWLSAKIAKIALGEVLGDAVRLGLMAPRHAEKVGRMILHDNVARLYGLQQG